MTTQQENVERLRRWNDIYESDGFEGAERIIEEIFDPEVEFSPLLARELEGRTYHGHDGLRAFFGELNDTLGPVRYEQPEFQPIGDEVIVLFTRLVGTGRGSTVPVEQDLAIVYEFHDGLVRRLTAYGSREEALRAAEELAAERGHADA